MLDPIPPHFVLYVGHGNKNLNYQTLTNLTFFHLQIQQATNPR